MHLKPLETAGQKWVGAQDAPCLEPLVFILLFFFYTTNAYLGLITLQFNTVGLKSAGIGCGSRHIASRAQVCFFFTINTFSYYTIYTN